VIHLAALEDLLTRVADDETALPNTGTPHG
jgi:hypothetical protein